MVGDVPECGLTDMFIVNRSPHNIGIDRQVETVSQAKRPQTKYVDTLIKEGVL